MIRTLSADGFEIGLHRSYKSFDAADTLAREREGLETASGSTVQSIRQHDLRFAPNTTWNAQVESGLRIDSTLGFAPRMGFRAGLAAPFRPWDFRTRQPFDIWEIPLVMMDGTLREYMRISPQEADRVSQEILERVASVGGAASILWHNSSFDDVDWRGWSAVYDGWLESTRRFGGWAATLASIVETWTRFQSALEDTGD